MQISFDISIKWVQESRKWFIEAIPGGQHLAEFFNCNWMMRACKKLGINKNSSKCLRITVEAIDG